MVREGKHNAKHFAHYKNSACPYTSGGESAVHLAAKLSLADYLTKGNTLKFTRACSECKKEEKISLKRHLSTRVGKRSIKDQEIVKVEHRLVYEGRTIVADLAILRGNYPTTIIEVFPTHAQENRPEPWYEFLTLSIYLLILKISNPKICACYLAAHVLHLLL